MSEGTPAPAQLPQGLWEQMSLVETVLLLAVTWGCMDGLARQAHQLVIPQAEER